MPNGPRIYVDESPYHIMVRGNRKQKVFICNDDYVFYLKILKKYKKKFSFKLYGYCLMPNHVHLIGEIKKAKNISKLMQIVNRLYTGYFNEKYKKVGHLWQGRFKSKVIAKDKYLLNCTCYIEQNPIRANLAQSPMGYTYSSYNERNMISNDIKILDEISL